MGVGVGDAILGQSRQTQWNPCGFYLTVQEDGRGRQSGLKIPSGESPSCSAAEAPGAFRSPDISAELSGFVPQFQTLIHSQDLKTKPHEHLKGHRTGRFASSRTAQGWLALCCPQDWVKRVEPAPGCAQTLVHIQEMAGEAFLKQSKSLTA